MRSLRGRLTFGVVLVLAAVLGVAGVLVSRYVEDDERRALAAAVPALGRLLEASS